MSRQAHSALAWVALLTLCVGCEEPRLVEPEVVTFKEVGPMLLAACGDCHGAERAEGGYRVDGYLRVIGCTPGGEVATEVSAEGDAPLLAVLSRADHAGLLDGRQKARLGRWIDGGAPARRGFVHPPGIVDPRSPDWHGLLASRERYRKMLNSAVDGACGQCHAGSPDIAPDAVLLPTATPCTDCHDLPGGVLACGTCHGQGEVALPPRDACFFPEGPVRGAHDTHLSRSGASAEGYPCATCHPEPGEPVISGTHGDGRVDVVLPTGADWSEPSWGPVAKTCAGGCHGRGEEPVAWVGQELDGCGSCHGAPPEGHAPDPCSTCHEAAPDGTAVGGGHLDGIVQPPEGLPCGACHGQGDDPWPESGAHLAHKAPEGSPEVQCASCHPVPEAVRSPGHLDDPEVGPEVIFSGVAVARGAQPIYDGQTCVGTACHGGPGARVPSPSWWEALERPLGCDGCHGAPPPPPHTEWESCQATICHGGAVAPSPEGPRLTPEGRATHVNGVVDLNQP